MTKGPESVFCSFSDRPKEFFDERVPFQSVVAPLSLFDLKTSIRAKQGFPSKPAGELLF